MTATAARTDDPDLADRVRTLEGSSERIDEPVTTIKGAAHIIDRSETTVRKRIASGQIKVRRIGARVLVLTGSLTARKPG